MILKSELITRSDGSIYHLGLHPRDVADDIITVGDPDRIDLLLPHMDRVILDRQLREFRTVTAERKGKRWTIISTGIGTDNIDIVFNELDALVNVDLDTRKVKDQLTSLNFYRLGTSGTLQQVIPVDSLVASSFAVDLGALCQYYPAAVYDVTAISSQVRRVLQQAEIAVHPRTIKGSVSLLEQLPDTYHRGITFTAPGFYAPQARTLRIVPRSSTFLQQLSQIDHHGTQATNLEMETAGIYLMASLLGHRAVSISAILANRITGEFSTKPEETIRRMIAEFFDTFGD